MIFLGGNIKNKILLKSRYKLKILWFNLLLASLEITDYLCEILNIHGKNISYWFYLLFDLNSVHFVDGEYLYKYTSIYVSL